MLLVPWSADYHTCKEYWYDILIQNRYWSGSKTLEGLLDCSLTLKKKTASETQGQYHS